MVHYLLQGILSPDVGYVSVLFVIGFCAALLGRLLALRLVQRLSHPSLLAFVLAIALFIGLGLLGVQMASHPIDWSVAPLCHRR